MDCYDCQFCPIDKPFTCNSRSKFDRHVKRHRIKCKYCNKIFYRGDNIKNHKKYCHSNYLWMRPIYGYGPANIKFADKTWEAYEHSVIKTDIGLTDINYHVILKEYDDSDNQNMYTKLAFINKTLDNIITTFKPKMKWPNSKIQITFNGNPNTIGEPMATKVMTKKNFNLEYISERAETLLNSNQNFILSQDFTLNVKLINIKPDNGGSGINFKFYDTYQKALLTKQSVLTKYRGYDKLDKLCFARSIILAMAYIRMKKR